MRVTSRCAWLCPRLCLCLAELLNCGVVATAGDTCVRVVEQVWDMKDLGLQATAHIMAAVETQRDPLARLAAVSGNFPALARWLSKQPVDDALRNEVGHNHRVVGAQEEAILVNGRVLDTASPSFNVFQLLKDLGEETPLIVRAAPAHARCG